MKRSRIRKNNRGDSLVLVIGCIALLSIIGVILLAKTMDNQQMKLAEEKAQASFAGAESGSAEMVTVIETAAHEVMENAFADMLLEYSLLADSDARTDRYSEYFTQKLKGSLETGTFQEKLRSALDVVATDVTVTVPDTDPIATEATGESGYTKTIRIKDVVFSYSTGDSTTTITTDICVKAKIPNVQAGFETGISCAFQDFAMISDGTVKHTDTADFEVNGNFYTGGDLVTDGSSAVTKINNAKKLLVKNEMKVTGGSQVWVKAAENSMAEGEGVWAGGISVDGSTFQSEQVNLYVKDDLSLIGSTPTVVMKGTGTEYVGYSGNATATANHERSSAITVNEIKQADTDGDLVPDKGLMLDLSGLGALYINGSSYICENTTDGGTNNWGVTIEGVAGISAADGILQGESVAYKEMQAMYLYPGSCLPQKHNPIIGSNVTIGTVSTQYQYKRPDSINWETLDLLNYVDEMNPYVTRTALLEGGSTVATYVYLNFKSEEAAAQYVQDYMSTFLGDKVKAQINNLGNFSRILLPTETVTLSNAVSFNGSSVTMIPKAVDLKKSILDINTVLAKQRSGGLFTSLRMEAGINLNPGYQMVADGILNMSAFDAVTDGGEKEVSVTDPDASALTYKFIAHDGDLTISESKSINGILVVNGDLTISAPTTVKGLVLVTGEVKKTLGTSLEADTRAVEVLLSNNEVANFFRIYGSDSGAGYLSSEAIKISFDKWKKN